MADTSIKLSGTYDSIEAYNILEEMRQINTDTEGYKDDAEAAASTATSAASTAQGHANNASTYADNAQTYAGNANTSASEAAGYASNASTSATNAATSETNASNSASAAATSESNASDSKDAAAASATAAAESAAEAAATLQNYLPLAGGTMTGAIRADTSLLVQRNALDSELTLAGDNGSSAPILSLGGRNRSSNPGMFLLRASDGTRIKELRGKPDGSLTWDGNDITPQTQNSDSVNSVSVANNTVTNLLSFSLTKGTWFVQVVASFASNATGYRHLGIGNTASQLNVTRFASTTIAAANGNSTNATLTTIIGVNSTTTYYVNVKQNSGSALTTNGGVLFFRLSPIA